MFLEGLQHKKIILWGTGEEAEDFFRQWDFYRRFWEKISKQPFPLIQHAWDSDPAKQGKDFHGWTIECPLAEDVSVNDYCIIAVARYAPIVQRLEQCGYERNRGFQRSQSFLASLRFAMVEGIKSILKDAADARLLDVSLDDIDRAVQASEECLDATQFVYHKMEMSSMDSMIKAVLGDLLLGCAIKKWMDSGWKRELFYEISRRFPLSSVVSGMAAVMDKHIDRLCNSFERYRLFQRNGTKIQTIGIYDLRYSNGGGQRVLSLLLPLYISMGYRVVFITDNIDDQEYPLPDGVVRIVLQHKLLGEMKLRLDEFSCCIERYHIDIMCFHYLDQSIRFLYDALYFKLLGIPILAEIHIMFLLLIKKRNYMAEQWKGIFRLMDRLIVLSRVNELFWKNLGCKATYIPNPVENGRRLWNRPIAFPTRTGKRILWIGRTEDAGKHLLDVVDIMETVRRAIPDAKLRIVGKANNLFRLRQLILEKHLEQAIEFAGYHTDATPFYEESDVMLMTSDMEGFPMVLVESKLHGVPTVMYELPYLELVKDSRGIISVPQRDKEAAAQALISILEDGKYRHRMSIEAKRSIYKFITYDIGGAWHKVINEISNPEEDCIYNSNQRIVQELLLKEIWMGEDV